MDLVGARITHPRTESRIEHGAGGWINLLVSTPLARGIAQTTRSLKTAAAVLPLTAAVSVLHPIAPVTASNWNRRQTSELLSCAMTFVPPGTARKLEK